MPATRALFVFFGLLLLVLPISIQQPLSAQTDTTPVFEPAPCHVNFPAGADVACGMVIVPQDRAHPDERTLRLAVAVFKAHRNNPVADPLIFLDGGPGARTLDSYAGGLGSFLLPINRQRDIILFDYRGIGHSDPALTCPESLEATGDEWVTACRARFEAQGVDVTDFTTRDNAADAADIVRALGYETYNVWGGSYGSSVAMTLLRDHPENVRAAIVTALQPPQGDLQAAIPVYLQRTIDTLSELCQANDECASAFPFDLTDALAMIVERLNTSPLPVSVHGVDTVLTGDNVLQGLGQLLKDDTNIPVIPGLIGALYAEQYDVVRPYVSALSPAPDPLNPIGAYLSMRCTDSILAVTSDAYAAALESVNPAFRAGYAVGQEQAVVQCQAWGARAGKQTASRR